MVWLLVNATPQFDGSGAVVSVVASFSDITVQRAAAAEHEHMIAELRTSLAEVRTLRGLLPICGHCKKIRDDAGYWNQIERYVGERTHAQFSHSICPSCMKVHYPELADNL